MVVTGTMEWNFEWLSHHIGNGIIIIPTDELTPWFFRGVGWNHQPANRSIVLVSYISITYWYALNLSSATNKNHLPIESVIGVSNNLKQKNIWKSTHPRNPIPFFTPYIRNVHITMIPSRITHLSSDDVGGSYRGGYESDCDSVIKCLTQSGNFSGDVFWVNYNDLTVLPHLVREIIPKWPNHSG